MTAWSAINGHLPDTLLSSGNGATLALAAAGSWDRAVKAGCPALVSASYRPYATQVAFYRDPPNSVGLAAYPGTSSHGLGNALDLKPAATSWLLAHPQYGWRRTIKAESWHWEYFRALDTSEAAAPLPPVVTLPTVTLPTPLPTLMEDDMARIVKHPNGTLALIGPGPRFVVLHTMTEADAVRATGQAEGDRIDLPNPLIWETCKAVALRAGTYSG